MEVGPDTHVGANTSYLRSFSLEGLGVRTTRSSQNFCCPKLVNKADRGGNAPVLSVIPSYGS
jgi:hypothetical protein